MLNIVPIVLSKIEFPFVVRIKVIESKLEEFIITEKNNIFSPDVGEIYNL